LLVVVAFCAISHSSAEEVEFMDPAVMPDLGESAGDADRVLMETERLLGEHDELLSKIKHAPAGEVLDLTHKIKALQSDIKGIRAKKSKLTNASKNAKKSADATSGNSKVSHMKTHIDTGAAAHDLNAQLAQKKSSARHFDHQAA